MKALSLTQPWAWIILHLGKRIENRVWPSAFRGPLLLHAAKGMTKADWYSAHDFVCSFDPEGASRIPKPKDPELVRGALVARARIVGMAPPDWCERDHKYSPRLLEQLERWHMDGQFGYVLDDVEPLATPIPWKGALGFWEAPTW